MIHRFHLFATGATSGLTLASLGECVRNLNWPNVLTFLGGAITAGISWYVSIRAAKREQDRLDREDLRLQRQEDVLNELKLQNQMLIANTKGTP